MRRRDFIKNTIPIASAPLIVGGMPINALAETPSLKKLVNGYEESDRALVLIFLDGGNDGINTIMPLDQYDVLMRDGSKRRWTIGKNALIRMCQDGYLYFCIRS